MPIYNIAATPRTSHLFGRGDTEMKDATAAAAAPESRNRNIPSSALASVSSSSSNLVASQPSRVLSKQPLSDQPAHSGPSTVTNTHFNHSLYFIEHLFPSKLWRILDDAEGCGYDHVISWVDNGTAFQIHDRDSVIPILEKYFNISKYKSFLRQLQAYGFQRALPNPMDDPNRDSKPKRDCYRGKWSHKLFRRDKMNLCNKMTRDGKSKQQDKESQQQQQQQQQQIQHRGNSGNSSKVMSIPLASKPPSASGAPSPVDQAAAAVMAKQQQDQQSQYQRQHNFFHLMQHQQSSSSGPSSMVFHDARYTQQQQQQQQQQQYLAQNMNTPAPPPSNNVYNGFSHTSLLTRIQQQEEDERRRQQLTIQLNQLKEQQLISILAARATANANASVSESTYKATSAPSPPPASNATTMLGGVNYNETKKEQNSSAEVSSTVAAAPSASASAPVPAPAPTFPSSSSSLSSSSASSSPKISIATDAVSAAVNELRQAELALLERRKRLVEAQEQARKEAELQTKARAEAKLQVEEVEAANKRLAEWAVLAAAAGMSNHHHHRLLGPASTRLSSEGVSDPSVSSENKNAPLTSFLKDLDNAFRSTANASATSLGTHSSRIVSSSNSNPSNAVVSNNNKDHKITEEELLRVKNEAAGSGKIPLDHRIHTGNPSSQPPASGKEELLARLNALEQFRLQDPKQVTSTSEQQQLLQLQLALQADRDRAAMGIGHNGGNANTSFSSQAVREAIHNAALGLVAGNNSGTGRHLSHDLRQGTVLVPSSKLGSGMDGSSDSRSSAGMSSASAPHQSNSCLLSQEMMDVYAKTAAAAISKKNGSIFPHVTRSGPVAAAPTSTLVTAPTSPSHPTLKTETADKIHEEMSITANNKSTSSKTSETTIVGLGGVGSDTATIDGAPDSRCATTANAFVTKEKISFSDELEAARALIRIPGSVTQSKGEAIRGHWELVRPEALRADGPLLKQLPEAVTRSAQLPYDSYKEFVPHMSPPQYMLIPDGWDPKNEPMYLVVDPVTTSTSVPLQANKM